MQIHVTSSHVEHLQLLVMLPTLLTVQNQRVELPAIQPVWYNCLDEVTGYHLNTVTAAASLWNRFDKLSHLGPLEDPATVASRALLAFQASTDAKAWAALPTNQTISSRQKM